MRASHSIGGPNAHEVHPPHLLRTARLLGG